MTDDINSFGIPKISFFGFERQGRRLLHRIILVEPLAVLSHIRRDLIRVGLLRLDREIRLE